ncbi:MAG: hypothetical protein WD379_09440 [Dehalococcoidia bacterium]
MPEAQDDLWHDVSVVMKHIRLIAGVFALAIIVAVISGIVAGGSGSAQSKAQIDVEAATPLFGGLDSVPDIDTFEDLALSDEVAQTAAAELDIGAEDVIARRSVSVIEKDPRNRDSVDQVTFKTTGDSPGDAQALAIALVDAFEERAEEIGSDPRAVASFQEQQDRALERLGAVDQSRLSELAAVQSDLARERGQISAIKSQVSAIDQALAVIGAESDRPIGELVVAVSGVLGGVQGPDGIEQAGSVEELRDGLALRRQLSEALVPGIEANIETLAAREQELLVSSAEQEAAVALYGAAIRNVEAADLAGGQTDIEVTVTDRGRDTSTGADWLARLGAAAAFGLVVGVVGALALEFLMPYWQRWRGGQTSAPREGS